MKQIRIGDKVINRHNKNMSGIVVAIESNRLPLIGLDCGGEFLRWIPHQDIKINEEAAK